MDERRSTNTTSAADGTPSNPVSTGIGASGAEILGVVWFMTVVALAALGARILAKRRRHNNRRTLWWDDHLLSASWVMLAGFAAATTYCVTVGLGTRGGGGREDSSSVPSVQLQLGILIATVLAVLGAALSKTSFGLTLLRVTRTGEDGGGRDRGPHRIAHHVVMAVVISLNIVLGVNAVIGFLWCRPAAAAWDPSLDGQCWDRAVVVRYTIFAAGYSALMDFVLAGVPWVVVMRLTMRRKEKLGLAFCMSLGVFAGCTSIMRAVTVPSLYSGDYRYEAGQLFIWTGAEVASTIVATSVPVLRVLFKDLMRPAYYRHDGGVGGVDGKGGTGLDTFRTLEDGEGIRVTHTTIVTRSSARPAIEEEEERLASPVVMPDMTYHSYLQQKK